MRDNETPRAHSVSIDGRKCALVTGVEAVESFNEQMVILSTSEGTLTMLGDGLHVSRLNLEDGKLAVEGEIGALEYDTRPKSGRGLFSRLVR